MLRVTKFFASWFSWGSKIPLPPWLFNFETKTTLVFYFTKMQFFSQENISYLYWLMITYRNDLVSARLPANRPHAPGPASARRTEIRSPPCTTYQDRLGPRRQLLRRRCLSGRFAERIEVPLDSFCDRLAKLFGCSIGNSRSVQHVDPVSVSGDGLQRGVFQWEVGRRRFAERAHTAVRSAALPWFACQ